MMSEVINYYNDLAAGYDEDRFGHSYGKFLDLQERRILDKLLTDAEGVILDCACGTGRLTSYATCGIDASKQMIDIARQKHPGKFFHVADAESTQLPDNSVDIIICFHFFMHLDADKIESVFAEYDRILKQKGRLIFDIPSKKRRDFLNIKPQGWHGAFSAHLSEMQRLSHEKFLPGKQFGLLMLPIHRFPSLLRSALWKIDFLLANSRLREYSSYLVFEFIKK